MDEDAYGDITTSYDPRDAALPVNIQVRLYNVPASSDESVDNTWNDPYWMFYWPGGQVLSRYILDNPKIFATKRVLDVGSGCGASAIAAAMMGARVVANDISKDAVEATKVNAALNNVSVDTSTKDFIGETDIDVDIVFLGDMFYDQEFTNIVYDWITHLSRNGTRILIGDPGRVHLLCHPIMDKLHVLQEYEIPLEHQETGFGLTNGVVWTFSPE